MEQNKRALIVGLGIAGMAAASRLQRAGWSPVIVERAPQRRTGGYFVGLFPEGTEAAQALGITDLLHLRTPKRARTWEVGPHGDRRRGVSFLEQPGNPEAVLRGDIEAALWSQIDGCVEVRFDTTPLSIRPHGDVVSVTLWHGDSGNLTEEEFDLVIGADGVRSTVRKMVFGPHKQFMNPLNAVICAFQMGAQIPQFSSHDGLVVADNRRSLWVFPLEDCPPTALFTYRPDNVDAQFDRPSIQALREAYAGLSADGAVESVLGELANAPQYLFDSVHYVDMPRWHHGRVVLIGDAAWCLTLYSGMGATSAMSGGVLLGDMLETYDGNIEHALQAWERELRPFIGKHRRQARFKAQVFVPSSRFLLRARSALIGFGAKRKLRATMAVAKAV